MADEKTNPMRELVVEKLTLNMGVGETGDKLEKAKILLNRISDTKVVQTFSKKRVPTWGLRAGVPIGVKTTIRGQRAYDLLKRLFQTVENRIHPKNFDSSGNLSFGIKEYIHIPGVQYDPSLGIVGLDVCVTLKRKGGNRIKTKLYRPAKIGKKHRIKTEECMEFFKDKFGIEIGEKKIRTYF
ncbi:MAG TPA: 50S ribosomal protein L5 [Candidatus Woesearchaeota archaeon]|nr:50S ribosomal protein L5 [Candidatus Woesearchaeota archaeon]